MFEKKKNEMKTCNFYSSVCTRTKLPENYLHLHQVNRQTILYVLVLFLSRGLDGGRGLPNKGLYGEVPSRDGPNPLPFHIPFLKERYPICIS